MDTKEYATFGVKTASFMPFSVSSEKKNVQEVSVHVCSEKSVNIVFRHNLEIET